MTFKTDIKFDESPVLRSLEKVAINKGLVTPDPVVKTASVEETYAPTDDLHEDMLKLVAGLRAKGFHREAEALEDKVNVRKFAETHLYRAIDEDGDDLLDFAHPEGDVEIAPSSSGLGKVWTEQSAKKEFLRVVNKQPTGKNASANPTMQKTADEAGQAFIKSELKARVNVLVEGFEEIWRNKSAGALAGKTAQDPWDRGVFLFDNNAPLKTLSVAKTRIFAFMRHHLETQAAKKDPKDYFNKIESYMNNSVGAEVHKQLGQGRKPWKIRISLHSHWQAAYKAVYKSVKDPGAKGGKKTYDKTHEGVVQNWGKVLNEMAPMIGDFCVRSPDKCTDAIKKIRNAYKSAQKRVGQLWTNRFKGGGYSLTNAQWAIQPIFIGKEKGKDIDDLMSMCSVQFERAGDFLRKQGYKPKTASLCADLTKLGQGFPPPGGEKPKTPKGGGSGYAQGGTKGLQQELLNLATLLKKYKGHAKTIEILEMKPYGADGSFMGKTKSALAKAENIRQKYKVQSPAIAVTNTPETTANLKALIAAINAGKWSEGGKGVSGGKQYDAVPNQLTTATMMQSGEIVVTNASFASLAVFHAFLLNNGLMEPKFYQGYEIVLMKPMQDALLWFQKRAQWISGAATRESKPLTLAYRRDVNRMIASFSKMVQDYQSKYNVLPQYFPVDHLSRQEPMAGGPGGKGSGYGQKGPGGKGAPGEGTQIELIGGGTGTLDSDIPPITRWLDLSDKNWWQDVDLDQILDFNAIKRMSGPNFATAYFSDRDDPMTEAMDFFRDIRGNLTRTWKMYSNGITNPKLRRGKAMSLLAQQMPAWQKLFKRMENDIGRDRRRRRRRRRRG